MGGLGPLDSHDQWKKVGVWQGQVRVTKYATSYPKKGPFSLAVLVSLRECNSLCLELETDTLPQTNIAPENWWLEDNISFCDGLFSGAMLVSGSVLLMFLWRHFEDPKTPLHHTGLSTPPLEDPWGFLGYMATLRSPAKSWTSCGLHVKSH